MCVVWRNGCVYILPRCVVELPVDFQLPVFEMGARDGAVVGVVRLLPSGLASGPLRIINEHFRL